MSRRTYTVDPAALQARLDRLARRGERELATRYAAVDFAQAAERSLPLVWLIPAFALALGLADRLLTGAPHLVHPALLLGLAVLAPLAWCTAVAVRARLSPIERRRGLVLVDRELGLDDRLTTADEFLAAGGPRGSFEAAAVADAAHAARVAEHGELPGEREGWRPDEHTAPHLVAGLLAVLAYAWLALVSAPTPAPPTLHTAEAPLVTGAPDEPQPGPEPDLSAEAEPRTEQAARSEAPAASADPRKGEVAAQLPDELRSSEGKTGQGKSADAQGQSAASESRGAPSGQTPAPPKDTPRKPLESKPPKKKDTADDPPRDPKEEGDPGGSTAGRGSAKGSNRNTVTSKWSAKDQVTTPDDQEIEDDEDTDDEAEEQENRGGMQPNLRDRRPPVSRDLRIGFGNQPSPDANGRGGPSEAKKSRGTASLVLGVPIPDRIKGQPNPGSTRITQERVEPSPEAHEPVEAEDRAPRELPVGQAPRPTAPGTLEPWMTQLIQRYLAGRRPPTP